MAKETIISNGRLNRYGSRVLTAGIDTAQYQRNPILLWMHNRAYMGRQDEVLPIGRVENLRTDGDNLIGTPVFDTSDPFAKKIADKWEAGFLKMVSAGLDIVETSIDAKHMTAGQTRPTIVKSVLTEVSIVDIGANDDAVVLMYNGKQITDNFSIFNHNLNTKTMEQKAIALKLGLPESASEAEVLAAIGELLAIKEENERSKQELAAVRLKAIESEVDAAVKLGKFSADRRAHFLEIGKKIGLADLKGTLECMPPALRPSQVINRGGNGGASFAAADDYKKWSDVPPPERVALRSNAPERYKELYRAEYGFDPVMN